MTGRYTPRMAERPPDKPEYKVYRSRRGFFDRFAQSWMRVAGPREIFAAAAKLNHRGWFGD